MQHGLVYAGTTAVSFELPSEVEEVVPGLKWGAIDAFPTPAYWKYQALARRIQGVPIRYRLGRTLTEEIAACLLGGHGIPASIGLTAFEHLKERGAFGGDTPDESALGSWLSEPIKRGDRAVHYRFARQKSKYLAAALSRLARETPPTNSGRDLRDWLLAIPGIGPKTASWIARNWLDADDVAIIDIHILRAGRLGGFLNKGLTVERHYLAIEKQFIAFSNALGIRPSELDAVIWHEMMSSPMTVRRLMEDVGRDVRINDLPLGPVAEQRNSNSDQPILLV
jgi:N-glycosylase/DNA lyase